MIKRNESDVKRREDETRRTSSKDHSNMTMKHIHGDRGLTKINEAGLPISSPEDTAGDKTAADGGYAWVIVFSAFMVCFLVDGVLFSFGVLLVVLVEDFNESLTSVAALGGIIMGCIAVSAPLPGSLMDSFGKRYVTIFGSVLFSTGLIFSMFAKTLGVLYFSYGVLGGVGFSLMVTPPLAAVMEHFSRKRTLAGGLAYCGSGLGTFVMNLLTNRMLEAYSWRGTFLILSGLMLNGIACGLAIPNKSKDTTHIVAGRNETCDKRGTQTSVILRNVLIAKDKIKTFLWKNNIAIFSDFRCLCILLSTFCFGLGGFVPFSYLPKQAVTLGMEKYKAAWLTSSMGLTTALGRIGIGWLGSRSFANRRILSVIFLLLQAVSLPISLTLTSFESKLAFVIVYGALNGCNAVLLVVLLAETVPAEQVNKTTGLIIAMYFGGCLIGVPLAGWTVDLSGSFNACYIIAGTEILMAAGFQMLPTLRCIVSRVRFEKE